MESELISILEEIATSYNLDRNEIIKKYSTKIKNISNDFEDPEIHTRCKGKNKNGKRCSKTKKESSEYCAIHYSQYKEKDTEFLPSSDIDKKKGDDSKCDLPNIIETTKKKGILPEKIKKIAIEGKKYYVNKNDWIYEMDQLSESMATDIPIGKLFSGKLMILKLDDI
jgi:hypothetical protein